MELGATAPILMLVTYLLVQAYQHLWLVLSNDIYQRFTIC